MRHALVCLLAAWAALNLTFPLDAGDHPGWATRLVACGTSVEDSGLYSESCEHCADEGADLIGKTEMMAQCDLDVETDVRGYHTCDRGDCTQGCLGSVLSDTWEDAECTLTVDGNVDCDGDGDFDFLEKMTCRGNYWWKFVCSACTDAEEQ
jgi:hypothetical protein